MLVESARIPPVAVRGPWVWRRGTRLVGMRRGRAGRRDSVVLERKYTDAMGSDPEGCAPSAHVTQEGDASANVDFRTPVLRVSPP
jgi:hypothetical protein